MKSAFTCVFICLLALVSGCTVSDKTIFHDVTYDFDVDVDFSQIKTYNWVKMPATSRIDDFNQIRIKTVVNAKLKALGMKLDVNKPDVFLVMYGGGYKAVDMTVVMDYAVYDVGRRHFVKQIGAGLPPPDLVVGLGIIHRQFKPAQKDDVIENSVQRILEHYPPVP